MKQKDVTRSACGMHENEKKCTQFTVGKLDNKGKLAVPRRRWNDTIEIELQDMR
jgi:hypothetical protein